MGSRSRAERGRSCGVRWGRVGLVRRELAAEMEEQHQVGNIVNAWEELERHAVVGTYSQDCGHDDDIEYLAKSHST